MRDVRVQVRERRLQKVDRELLEEDRVVQRRIRELRRVVQRLHDRALLDELEHARQQLALQLEPALVVRVC